MERKNLIATITDNSGIKAYALSYGSEEIAKNLKNSKGNSIVRMSTVVPENLNWVNIEVSKEVTIETSIEDYNVTLWKKNVAGGVSYLDLTPKPNLTIDPNGGTYNESPGTSVINMVYKETLELNVPTKEGHTFNGWDISETEESKVTNNTFTMGEKDTTVTAIWTANKYTLTINPDGGTYNGTQENTTLEATYREVMLLQEPIKENYTFTHWSVSSEKAILNTNEFQIGSEEATLTANWIPNNYPWVAYHNQMNTTGEGYTVVDADTTKGQAAFGSTVTPEVKTYTGFTKPEVQSITILKDEEPISVNVVNYNYDRNKYTLTINPNGGTYNSSTENTITEEYYGSEVTIAVPTLAGYSLESWTLEGSGEIVDSTLTMGLGNVTLTANWEAAKIILTLNSNGGTETYETRNVPYGGNYGELPTPTRDGYTFKGWFTAASGGLEITSTTPVTKTAAHTIYAHWLETCPYTNPFTVGTLKYEMFEGSCAYPDNIDSPFVETTPFDDAGISFGATSENCRNDFYDKDLCLGDATNGKGLYTTSTNTEGNAKVYYYRGQVENNYLLFANHCWRIVRTNEDGSVKIRYGGTPTIKDGQYFCPQTGQNVGIENGNDINYYTKETAGIYNGYVNSTGESSNIKNVVDNWYATNIASNTNYSSLVANTIYCIDSSTCTPTTTMTGYTIYGAYCRITESDCEDVDNIKPQFKCSRAADKYTLSVASGGTSGYGNNKLTYPVSLLTIDEVIYAGSARCEKNQKFFLHTGARTSLVTPYHFHSSYKMMSHFFLDDDGSIGGTNSGYLFGYSDNFDIQEGTALPVISLVSDVSPTGGNGSYNNPFRIGPTN